MNDLLIKSIRQHANPLSSADDLDFLIKEIGDAKIVLLGESSHGTSEFYKIRAEISKRLITEKGFSFIAVEGDWPACQDVNHYIKAYDHTHKKAREVLNGFNRWPSWMWANEEVRDLIDWLRDYNHTQRQDIGFYGIDVYSLWESMDEIIHYLKDTNSPELSIAKKVLTCFEPYYKNHEKYAISAGLLSDGCVNEVTKLLAAIRSKKYNHQGVHENELNLKVNALVMANAENYYRTMVVNDNESWNIRDEHMVEALHEVMDFYGDDAKVIVWEHNTHVGDARATDMKNKGMINVGQLIREQHSHEDVYIVGFGTHHGTVIAADEWGVNFESMKVPHAQIGSWEDFMHKAGAFDKLLIFNEKNRHLFRGEIGHRAIGVVYNPEFEQYGNYVPSVMSERYDAFIYIDESNALSPLHIEKVYI